MLDPILFRNQLPETAEKLKHLRGFDLDVGHFERFESERKRLQSRTQELQNLRNTRSKAIGQAKAKGEDVAALMAEVAAYGDELKVSESDLDALTLEMHSAMAVVPNIRTRAFPSDATKTRMSHSSRSDSRRFSTSRSRIMSRSANATAGWMPRPAPNSRAPGSAYCAANWRSCTAPWRSSCSIPIATSTAMSSTTRR